MWNACVRVWICYVVNLFLAIIVSCLSTLTRKAHCVECMRACVNMLSYVVNVFLAIIVVCLNTCFCMSDVFFLLFLRVLLWIIIRIRLIWILFIYIIKLMVCFKANFLLRAIKYYIIWFITGTCRKSSWYGSSFECKITKPFSLRWQPFYAVQLHAHDKELFPFLVRSPSTVSWFLSFY